MDHYYHSIKMRLRTVVRINKMSPTRSRKSLPTNVVARHRCVPFHSLTFVVVVLGLLADEVRCSSIKNQLDTNSHSVNDNAARTEALPSIDEDGDRKKEDSAALDREIYEQLTANNPCLVHYCPKGRECIIASESNQPICVCQRYCSHRKRPICGSDGHMYDNHCELHRAACRLDKSITYQSLEKCSKRRKKIVELKKHKKEFMTVPVSSAAAAAAKSLTIDISINEVSSNDQRISAASIAPELVTSLSPSTSPPGTVDNRNDYCTSQEYEIMKDNLLLYSHARLMSQDNNHSKDFLVSIMFSHYDQNNNAHLEVEELNQISLDEHLEELSNGCVLADMLSFDDANHDGMLSINEFYQAFSKLYSVSVVSLDKALETNHLSARVGDNVEIKCDVTGSPSPPLIWIRNGVDLSPLNEEEIRVFSDGSLYLTRIQLWHAGNYSCHAQRNKDVVQTHILQIYTVPEVRVMPRIQSRRPRESAEMFCHITGDPFPKVEWLKNDEKIKFAMPGKYELVGNGTALKVHNIAYADTGAYMCQAVNVGGSVRDISSLIVQEEPTPTVLVEDRKFFVFHEYGIAVYEPDACRLHHQIHGTDIIPGTQEYVCGGDNAHATKCNWGRAIGVGTHYIYSSQPERDRILVISTIQMVVVDVIATDKYPVELHYVARLDQVWVLNWLGTQTNTSKTIQVIRDAGQKRKHHTVHPEPIDGQFDLVAGLFIPSVEIEQPHYSYKYAYVTHRNQRGLYKLDLENLRYARSIDLTLYNCVPDSVEFSALYGFVILSCREPVTGRQQGQLVLDYLTDAIITAKSTLNGTPKLSPDSRHLSTIEHKADNCLIVIQKITPLGLEFLFDVKTTLKISDVTFYESQSMHGYDLFASASDKDDILYINLFTGKVEMITGVGPAMAESLMQWGNPTRIIRSSGLFGRYMVTTANNALFVINGKARTINCEIGGILHPVGVVWVHNLSPSYMTSMTSSANVETAKGIASV